MDADMTGHDLLRVLGAPGVGAAEARYVIAPTARGVARPGARLV